MDKKELERLIKESLSEMSIGNEIDFQDSLDDDEDTGGIEEVSAVDQELDTDDFESSLGTGIDDYDDEDMNLGLEPMPMSQVDMPIQDKGMFNMGGDQSYDDEFSDVSGYVDTPTGDPYEDYQDDVSVSPGYFNEDEEVSMSDIDMPIQDKGVFAAMDSEEVEDSMSDIAKYRRDKGGDYEGGYQDDVSVSPGYFNEEELAEMIREGVEKLHRKSLLENRLEQINDELNMMANPEAWEAARTDATNQLKKKHVAWQEITTTGKIMSEGISENNAVVIQKWIDKVGHRGTAKKLIDTVLRIKLMGMTSDDLGDTAIFSNGLDTAEEFLISGEFQSALDSAKETAMEMIEDEQEGMGGMFESKSTVKGDLLSEMSFRDIEIPVIATKDTATKEANSKWDNMQKESVSEIMGRAADLMAEAKKKYNNISK